MRKLKKKKKDKLKCEEYLEFLRFESTQKGQEFDFPYLILRLPDVIGPYDDTNRYWSYLKLMSEYEKFQLQIVSFYEKNLLISDNFSQKNWKIRG